MQRNKSRRSAACNIMRLWLIDYLVCQSQELPDAKRKVQWFGCVNKDACVIPMVDDNGDVSGSYEDMELLF